MNIIRNLQTSIKKNLSASAEDLQALREQVLNTILIGISIFGAINLVVNAIPIIQAGNWVFLSIFITAYLGILITASIRRIPYGVRAAILVLIPLALALTDFIDLGLSGDGMIWLFTSALLTSILFGARWTMVNWGIQTILLFTFAFLTISGRLVVSTSDSTSLISWLELALDYILVGFIATIGLNLVVTGLERSLITTQHVSGELVSRTRDLERRLNQLQTVAEISRTISGELASENFLQNLVDLMQLRLNLYYVGVFLIDDSRKFAVLQAGTGEPGKIMMENHHKFDISETSMIGWCIANQQPRIALDVGQEAVRFNNPHLPLTRSELALPLRSSTTIMGAVTIQSIESQAFDPYDLTVLQGLADSLATAIENSRLFEQTQEQLEELNTLYSASLAMYTSVQSQESLLTVAHFMLNVSGAQNYVVSSWEDGQDEITTIFGFTPNEDVSSDIGKQYKLSDYPLTEKVLRERKIITVRVDDPQADAAEVALLQAEGLKSLLMVPLVAHDKVLGLMELHDENSCRDFTPQQIHLVEALSAQVAVVLEITNLIERNRRTARNERIISQITAKFQQTITVEEVMKATITELSKALGLKEAIIQLGLETNLLNKNSNPNAIKN